MAVNDSYTKVADSLSDGANLIVDGSGADTNAVNITEIGATGDCKVYREFDPNTDSTYEVSSQIDSPTETWHSQGNDFICSQSQNSRLRINNTSGGTIDVWTSGYEVSD